MANGVPTQNRLMQRGLTHESTCQVCGKESESTIHMLFLCEHARATWFGSQLSYIPNVDEEVDLSCWWSKLLLNLETEKCGALEEVVSLMWFI